ncbi:hypothetical protein BB559_005584 [Furculomyces boomerangus]|uniref:Uncharacterized protein n=2 Tax=Harpellales TaxID=61421 RepID=A0A2T9Y7T4_9FUNG|nr:hypothetical protein BB559_005584 [Furculomyces boomerangus]
MKYLDFNNILPTFSLHLFTVHSFCGPFPSSLLASRSDILSRARHCCDIKNKKPCEFMDDVYIGFKFTVKDDGGRREDNCGDRLRNTYIKGRGLSKLVEMKLEPGKCGEAKFQITTNTRKLCCLCCSGYLVFPCQINDVVVDITDNISYVGNFEYLGQNSTNY